MLVLVRYGIPGYPHKLGLLLYGPPGTGWAQCRWWTPEELGLWPTCTPCERTPWQAPLNRFVSRLLAERRQNQLDQGPGRALSKFQFCRFFWFWHDHFYPQRRIPPWQCGLFLLLASKKQVSEHLCYLGLMRLQLLSSSDSGTAHAAIHRQCAPSAHQDQH